MHFTDERNCTLHENVGAIDSITSNSGVMRTRVDALAVAAVACAAGPRIAGPRGEASTQIERTLGCCRMYAVKCVCGRGTREWGKIEA